MGNLSYQADVSNGEVGQPREGRLVLKAVLLLIGFTALAHLPLLVSDSIMWDSMPLANAIEEDNFDLLYRVFRSGGLPQSYYLHSALGHVPNYLLAYKLTAYFSLLGATVCIFWLCLSVRFLGLPEAFAIAAIAAVYPFYGFWQEMISITYGVCYFLFLLAACCYSQYLSDPPTSKRWLVLSLLLFMASFSMQSLLVCFYALFLFFFLRQEQGYGIAAAWRFCLRNAAALATPVVFFVAVRLLFPTHGTYEAYNKIELSPVNLAKWLVVVPKRLVVDPVKDLAFAGREPLFFLALVGFSLAVLWPAWWAMRLPSRRLSGRQFALTLGYAVLLYYLAMLPYSIVGKFPVINTYFSRHGMLAAVPIAIGLVVVLRFTLRNDWLFGAGVGMALVFCLVLQTRGYILWQNRYIKYLAVLEYLEHHPDELAGFVVLEDKADFGMPEQFRTTEINWLTKRAYGNERHMGFDALNFTQDSFHRMDVPAKHEYYMSGDFKPGHDASWITIKRDSDDTE
jgi:hypothetical protein